MYSNDMLRKTHRLANVSVRICSMRRGRMFLERNGQRTHRSKCSLQTAAERPMRAAIRKPNLRS